MKPVTKSSALSRIVPFSLLCKHTKHIFAMILTRSRRARAICSFCDYLSVFADNEVSSEMSHEFFHGECSTCEPQQDGTLCDFCRHLRIRHLSSCRLTSGRDGVICYDIDISPSRSCPFCQLLTSIINREKSSFPGNQEDINKRHKKVYLRLIFDLEFGQIDLGLVVGVVFYAILPHEQSCGWETSKQQRQKYDKNMLQHYDSIPLNVGKKVQWDQVRGWLKECTNHHDECSKKRLEFDDQLAQLPDGFMVIDVNERKVVNGGKDCQFVALSYIWGNTPDDAKLKATMKTIQRLRRRNGVSAHRLPATIEDAIQICIKLGEQYLWIDRLCIVQDDHENKQHQIDRMASIYASASLVIVVTEGDMESGIIGVRHDRPTQDFKYFSGSTFSYSLPRLRDSIKDSRWATRGWTYQEAVLARKKLFFTPSQVYYTCGSTTRSENFDRLEGGDENAADTTLRLYPISTGRIEGRLISDWEMHLEAYTSRSLSHSSDIYNAFIGICSAIYIEEDPLLYGLPRKGFDQALLWCCIRPAKGAPPHQIRTPEKDEDLPSWSWSSVMGIVSLNGSYTREWGFCGSLVEWTVKRSGNSNLEQAMHPDKYESPYWWPFSAQFYLAIAWSQGCLKKPWLFHQLSRLEFSSFKQKSETLWTSPESFARDCIWGRTGDMEKELQRELLKNRWILDKTLLISCVQTARFRLSKHRRPHSPPSYSKRKHFLLEIINEEGHCIGMLAESEPRAKEEVWPYLGKMNTFEFVALSISRYRSFDFALQCVLEHHLLKNRKDREDYGNLSERDKDMRLGEILRQRSRSLTVFDRDGVPLDPVPVVNVMLIGRDQNHHLLAHRVSIGWILLAQWAKAKRQFKTIFLE